jgi:hypothetical protein
VAWLAAGMLQIELLFESVSFEGQHGTTGWMSHPAQNLYLFFFFLDNKIANQVIIYLKIAR